MIVRSYSDARFSTFSTRCNLSEQYLVEETVHVIKCTLLLRTVLSAGRAGSMPALRLCKRGISV